MSAESLWSLTTTPLGFTCSGLAAELLGTLRLRARASGSTMMDRCTRLLCFSALQSSRSAEEMFCVQKVFWLALVALAVWTLFCQSYESKELLKYVHRVVKKGGMVV